VDVVARPAGRQLDRRFPLRLEKFIDDMTVLIELSPCVTA
jgi:hypothetical protein